MILNNVCNIFEEVFIMIRLANGMANVQVENVKISTTYSDTLDILKVSEKIEKLISKEREKKSSPILGCFAFGETFKREVVGVLKGRC